MSTVSVIVVNYNRKALLKKCLDSLLVQTRPADRIILVDNGSNDGSVSLVEKEFGARVDLVRLEENTGFAVGNNRGAELADTEWLALINNDAVADPRWLEQMMKTAEVTGAGMIACAVLRARNRDLFENDGVGMWPDGMSRGTRHFRKAVSGGKEVFVPSGCAMMIRKDLFDAVGGFDEDLISYSEDTDLGIKARLLGAKCVLSKNAVAYHDPQGGTLGGVSAQKTYLVERNRIKILVRYYPLGQILLSPVYTAVRYLGLARSMFVRPSDEKSGEGIVGLSAALLKAYWHGALSVSSDLNIRKEWRDRKVVHPGSMEYWLSKYRLDWSSLVALEEP